MRDRTDEFAVLHHRAAAHALYNSSRMLKQPFICNLNHHPLAIGRTLLKQLYYFAFVFGCNAVLKAGQKRGFARLYLVRIGQRNALGIQRGRKRSIHFAEYTISGVAVYCAQPFAYCAECSAHLSWEALLPVRNAYYRGFAQLSSLSFYHRARVGIGHGMTKRTKAHRAHSIKRKCAYARRALAYPCAKQHLAVLHAWIHCAVKFATIAPYPKAHAVARAFYHCRQFANSVHLLPVNGYYSISCTYASFMRRASAPNAIIHVAKANHQHSVAPQAYAHG